MKRLFVIVFLASPLGAQEDLLIGLVVMDIVSTNYIASTGGTELNPLLPADDLFALATVKGGLVAIWLATKPSKKQVWIMSVVTSTAVVNNLWQIHKHQRRNHES